MDYLQLPPDFRELLTERAGCLIFTGSTDWEGRGVYRGLLAHRFVRETLRDPLPARVDILHTCRNLACVRLNHLELATPSEKAAEVARRGTARSRKLAYEDWRRSALIAIRAGKVRSAIFGWRAHTRPIREILSGAKGWTKLPYRSANTFAFRGTTNGVRISYHLRIERGAIEIIQINSSTIPRRKKMDQLPRRAGRVRWQAQA